MHIFSKVSYRTFINVLRNTRCIKLSCQKPIQVSVLNVTWARSIGNLQQKYVYKEKGRIDEFEELNDAGKSAGLTELFIYPDSTNPVVVEKTLLPVDNKSDTPSDLNMQWQARKNTNWLSPDVWLKLSKFRLTGLVVMTSVAGYVMAPLPIEPLGLLACGFGTALVSGSANSFNQFLEIPYDSQMARTKNRVLVQYIISPLQAVSYAIVSGSLGLATLYYGVNGLCAGLGLFNLILYSFIYTPMKRLSSFNTWLGSIVGAIPPLMGWVGCTNSLDPGAFVLAAILYTWQFPHFNSLSWNLRGEYSKAGYRMMCVTEPDRCRRTTMNHSLYITGICALAPVFDVATLTFTITSIPVNLYLVYLSHKFKSNPDSKSSRSLFRYTLLHLPVLMSLLLLFRAPEKKPTQTKVDQIEAVVHNLDR